MRERFKLYSHKFNLEYGDGVARINIIQKELGEKYPNKIEVIVTQVHNVSTGLRENIFNIEFNIWPDGEPASGQRITHLDADYLPYTEPIISKKDKMEILEYIMENAKEFGISPGNDK